MENESSPKTASRRKVLATTGSVLAMSSIPVVTSADRDLRDIYEESLRLRRKNDWDTGRWRQYLQDQDKDDDIDISDKQIVKSMQSSEDGEVGPNHISDKSNLVLDCTLIGNGTYGFADMEFEANDSIWQLGKDPNDGLAFGWDSDEYDYDGNSNSGWYASDESLIDIAEYSGRGVSFSFEDEGHVQEGHWVSADLSTEGGTPSTRNVIYSYMHTWNGVDVESITVSTSGVVSVTLSDNTYKWDSPAQDQLFEA